MLKKCLLCPRNCGVNRAEGSIGFCNSGKDVKIAKAYLHQWEEPCVSGSNGSGTVFFSNCNLRCVFCQNYKISHESLGKEVTVEELGEIFIKLQKKGAHNINLVTPTHYAPQIIEALKAAKKNGLSIPVLYNTNSYENVETIKALNGHVDVYLADLKYFKDDYAIKYSAGKDYFYHASRAIMEMFNQVGKAEFDENGMIIKGIVIRHLMLPGLLFDSKKVIDHIYQTFGDDVFISLMNQYTPMYKAAEYTEINKNLKPKHYDSIIEYCLGLGIHNAFIQDSGTASEAFVPDFDVKGF